MATFRKAERKKAKLRLGIVGPAGSGKTYSSLLIAAGLGGRIALIDTENGSGDLYAGFNSRARMGRDGVTNFSSYSLNNFLVFCEAHN